MGQTLVWRRNDPPDRAPKPRRVVAVVKDARYAAADLEPIGDVYVPGAIGRGTYGSFFIVSTADPAAQESARRRVLPRDERFEVPH